MLVKVNKSKVIKVPSHLTRHLMFIQPFKNFIRPILDAKQNY
jgi:hypothetical protein